MALERDAEQLRHIFSQNLRGYMNAKRKTMADLASDLGVSFSAVADWYHGRKYPRMDKVQALADYFGVMKSDLTEEHNYASNIIQIGMQYKIPVLGRIAAGMPIFAEENIEGYELADVTTPDEYFYLRVQGDSMVGAHIFDGSLVLIRQQPCADDGQIVACLVNGEDATLKRFRRQGDTIILMPENSAYAPIILQTKDFDEGTARILGVAVEVKMKL